MKAQYISLWANNVRVSTLCEYEPQTNLVFNIDTADVEGLEILLKEYVELPDGTRLFTFTCEDDRIVINGEVQEEI